MNKPPVWVQDYEGLTRYGGADDETRFMTAEYANALEAKARWAEDVALPALEALAKVQYDGTVEGLRYQIEHEDWGDVLPRYITNHEFRAKADALKDKEQKNLPPWQQGRTALGTPRALRMGEDEATHVNCLSKVADQYLGALKLLWPHRPPSLDNELKAQAEQIAEKAFGLEKK